MKIKWSLSKQYLSIIYRKAIDIKYHTTIRSFHDGSNNFFPKILFPL